MKITDTIFKVVLKTLQAAHGVQGYLAGAPGHCTCSGCYDYQNAIRNQQLKRLIQQSQIRMKTMSCMKDNIEISSWLGGVQTEFSF